MIPVALFLSLALPVVALLAAFAIAFFGIVFVGQGARGLWRLLRRMAG